MNTISTSGEIRGNDSRRRRGPYVAGLLVFLVIGVAAQGFAQLSVKPITWDVVGLDSNRPLTSGPDLFPVGAEVCAVGAPSAGPINVDFIWTDGNGGADPYINSRPGSLTTLSFAPLAAGECIDAYFELQLTRSASAFGNSREYSIEATDGTDTVTTPSPRQIYIEYLVSQNRNTTQQIRYGQQEDKTDWQTLGNGGSINLLIGETYFIELTTATSTGYEELQSFLTLSNTIFQVLSVSTTYGVQTAPLSRVPDPNPQLWADGCLWESDPDSPNYLSCLADGKAGGQVVTTYEIRIISGGGDQVGLEALIYDRSGGSYHYNTDFSQSPGDLTTVDPAANAAFAKRFIPDTIGADGISTLRLTITNPNPVSVSGYSFSDSLPTDGTSQVEVAATPNVTNTCGGSVTAGGGATVISLADGLLDANSSCTILVDVTVPDVVGATYPLALLNSVDLYVGAAGTPSATATATLNVTAEPPPPQDCTDVTDATLATWATFNSPTAPTPTTNIVTASALVGTGLDFSVSADTTEWEADAQVANQTLAQAITTDAYYEFRLDTTGIDSIDLSLIAYRQNGQAPASITLYYGPAGNLVESTTLNPLPTQNSAPVTANFLASSLTNLNSSGETLFRIYAYNAAGTNSPASMLNVIFTGSGTLCTPIPPGSEPDPPEISKSFSPDAVSVGATSTLTFTLTNPNTDPADDLTGVTFRDELPSGMTVVGGSLDNLTCGGTWVLDSTSPDVVLLTGVSLAEDSSCQVSVQVFSTTVGSNVNLSDPVDAAETYPGNSAVDTLTVQPPPSTPTIAKSFDPNPLLDPTGATNTTLVFEITNTDPLLDISGVAFADTLPSGMSFVTGTIAGDCGGGTTTISTTTDTNDTFTLANGAITADLSCTIEVDVAISAVDVSGGPVTFDNQSGLVSHVFNGITYTGNDAEATLVVDNPIPAIAIRKEIALSATGPWTDYLAVVPGVPSTQVWYRITVENIGETALDPLTVTDDRYDISGCGWPSSLPVAAATEPPPHVADCVVGPFTVQSGDEIVTNTATASGTSPASTVVTDTDSATYAVPDLTLTKGASPAFYTAAGQTISYTYTVANIAPSASLLGPVTVADDRATVTCPALTDDILGDGDDEDAYFEPGESIVCTATYTITAGDVTAGSVTNTATATVDGFDSPEDSATVFLPVPPTIAKAFGSDPVAVGTTSDLTITVTNNAAIALSGVGYSDVLPAGLSFVTGTISGSCGGGTAAISTTTNTNDTFSLSGGAIAASGSCGITVTVSAGVAGSYTNTTSVVSSTEVNGTTTGSDTLDVTIAGPTIAKSFADTLIGTGETTTLTITATNAAATALSNVAYSDVLPAGLSFVTGTISGNCGGGTAAISTTTNTNDTFSLSGGAIAASGNCAITLDVSGDVEGSYTNTTSVVTSDEVDGTTTGSDDLDVEDLPTIGKSFDDATVATGEATELTITVTNNAAATTLTGVSFSDQLPVTAAGELEYVAPVGGTCSGLTGFAAVISDSTATSDLLSVSGFDLAAGVSCTVTVDVQGNTEGDYTNTTSVVSSTELTGTGTGTDDVEVGDLPTIAKSFATDPINVGGTSVLTITATNNAGFALTGVSFSDQLPVGLAYSGTATTDTCGGTTSINAGTRTLSVSGGSIAADGSCTIEIAVQGLAGGNFNNVTSVVDSTELTGTDTGSDTLTVNVPAPTIAKAFGSDPVAVGTTSDLTITVTNNAAIALSGVGYSDVLPAGLSFVTGTISGSCGGGTAAISTTTNTNDTFSLSGGAIAASGSCGITVTVSAGVAGSYTNTTSVVSSTEVNGTTTGSDTLDVTIAGPTIAKSFADTLIGTGETTTLTITATNAAATALSNVAYSDVLPAGLSFVTGTISGNCGGGTAAISTTTNTNDTFSLSGGAIAASGNCAITLDVSGDVEGSYTNTTSVVTSDEVDGTTTGSDDLDVEDLPTIGKSFDDATVATGEATELTITVTNNAAATTLTGVSFSDQLPVTAAGELEYVAPVGGTCSGLTGFAAVISDSTATSDLLSVSGFDLAAGVSCTVTVDVQGNTEGDYTNTTSVVSSTELTGTGTGTDDVEVGDLPTIAKSFATDPINVGGTSVLTITATNNAGFALTGVSFSDQLPVGLAYSGTATTDTCGGTTSINAGTRTLSVSGGSIAADGSCTIEIAVQGLAGGNFNNVTSVVDSTELTGTDTGSDTLTVNVPAPTIAKAFGSDPVAVGTTSDLTITVTNNAAIALSGVGYSDVLPAGLSFVTGTISGSCGGGTAAISTTTNTNDTFSLSGGAIAASGSCGITVTVSAGVAGSYTNTTSVVSSTEVNGTTTGSDTLDVTIAGPTIAKSFADTLIGTGETTTLTITATNAAATALSNVAYSDVLPAGLSFVTGTISGNCGGGTAAISTTTNTNDTFSLSGGAIAASGNCAITLDVSGDVEGSYTNTTSVVTSDEVDGTTTGSDDLDVEDLPTIGKSFDDATVATGEATELTITVTNNAAATTLTGVSFSDQLPVTAAGELEYVAPVGGTCSGLTGFAAVISDSTATSDLLSVSGFDLAAGVSCTVTVDVQGNTEGDYTNTTSVVSSTELTGTGTGTDDVEVGDLPTIAKSFATDPINVGGTSVLTITATNNAGFALTGVSFSDQLPVGLAYSGTATTDTCGGTTSINAGTRTLSVSGGSIAADGSCTIEITVQGLAGGNFNNVTSVVDSTELTGTDTGSDTLTVNVPAPTIAKAFGSDPVAVGTTSDLTITVTNNAAIALSGVGYSDVLPAGLSFVTGTISGSCGGGTAAISTTTNTNDTFSLSGGAIAASGSCGITVTVSAGVAGSYTNTTSVVSSTEVNGTTTGSDTLDVTIAGPTIAKSFADTLIGTGETTTLTITATNAAATALSNVAYSDVLPAGLSFVTGTISGDCGGGTAAISTTTNTNDTFSLSGGAIAASGNCAITLDVSGDVEGSYTNTTSVVTSDEVDGTTTGSDDLDVEDLPTIGKSFDDATVATGEATELTITVTNNAAATTLTGVSFSDQLPVTAAGELEYVAPVGGTCSGLTGFAAVISDSTATSDLLSVSGFDLAAGVSCTVTVDVQGNTEGDYTNTTSVVSSTELTGTGTGTDDVEVGDLPTIAKSFATDPINVGGTSVLTITATNNAGFALTGVSFSDQLPVGLAYSGTATTDTCGGTTSINAGTRTLSVSGGSIAADGSCTIEIAVQGLAGGNFNNVTSVVDSTELTGTDTGSDTLTVNVPAPTIAKAFGSDPVAVGTTSDLTITVTNNAAIALSGVGYSDVLPAGLSFVTGTISGSCGGGTAAISTTTNTNDTFSLSGGAIAASGSCGITVTVSAGVAGSYTNTTSVVSSTEVNGTTTGSDTLDVTIAGPTIAKSFADTLIGTGETTTLTITATNAAATALSNVAYSDVLPAGLSFVTGTISGDCGGGTAAISTTTNTNDTFSLSGGAIAASGNCAITLDVSGDVEGSYTNTTSVVTSDEVDGTTTGSDDLDVEDLPTIGKSFDDATVATGEATELTITVTNNAAATTLTGVSFSDQLPVTAAGELEYVAPVGGTCSGLTGFAAVISDSTATSDLLSVSGFDLAAGVSCTVTVDVQGNTEGDYTNTTSVVSSTELTGTGTGTDDVEVGDLPTIAKSFATDPINVGGTSVLTITATNNAGFALTGVSFSDQLPVGLAYSGTATTDTCGGTTSINAGTRTLSVSGGSIAADGSCTIEITVQGLAGGNFNNVTSVVDSTELTGTDTGSDTLTVNVPAPTIAIEKTQTSGSDPVTAVGQVLGYTIVVTNTGVVDQTGVSVFDTLPDGSAGTLIGPTESITVDNILESGETWTYTISYTVTQADINDGSDLVNTTSVVTTEVPGPTTDTETTPVTPPSLRLSASKVSLPGDGTPVTGGDTITYALILEVSNGPTTADVVLTDTLGPGLTFGSITDNPGGFVGGGSGNNRTFTLSGSVAPGTYMVEYTATVNLDATGTTVYNFVLIAGGGDPDPDCVPCSTGHPLESEIEAIPTASTFGLLLMIGLLAGAALLRLRSG